MTPSTPGLLHSPASCQRLVQPLTSEVVDGCAQVNASWAYLSDVKMRELAVKLLQGCVAPELLRELGRRELVALLAAHQKATSQVQDVSIVGVRPPSPSVIVGSASQSPPPLLRQSTPVRAHATASNVEVARNGPTALDATTTALMRIGYQNLPPSLRTQSPRREAAGAGAMRAPVLQSQRLIHSRSCARYAGVIGASGMMSANSVRIASPLIQRGVSSASLGLEQSPSPKRQVTETWKLHAAPRNQSSRRKRQSRRELDAMEASEGDTSGHRQSRMSCGTGVDQSKVSGSARSGFNHMEYSTSPPRERRNFFAALIRSSSARAPDEKTASFTSLLDTESRGQTARRSSDIRRRGVLRDSNFGENNSRSASPIAHRDARSFVESSVHSSNPVPFSSATRRLDATLAEKLATADRELSLARGAATRFAIANHRLVGKASPLHSAISDESSMLAEDLSVGRRSEDYDAELIAKMREIEKLQIHTEHNMSKLASCRRPSRASLTQPSRETSLSPPQHLRRHDAHEKALSFKYLLHERS